MAVPVSLVQLFSDKAPLAITLGPVNAPGRKGCD